MAKDDVIIYTGYMKKQPTTNGCQVKPVAVFLVLDWCCAVHGSDKMALRVRRVMARAKARVIMVYIYIAMEHRG